MSPHGDLIAFGAIVLAVIAPPVWYYLYLRWAAASEQERHNKAIEKAIDELRAGPAELRLRLVKRVRGR